MPSEDSKGGKKEGEEESLGSMLQAQKKNLKNIKVKNAGASSSTPKLRPTAAKTSNKVKKEEPQDDDDDFDVPIKCKVGSKSAKVKKEEDEDSKPISRRASTTTAKDKQLSKKKNKMEEVKKKRIELATPEQNGKKREKKVYDLPGQKRDPPEERDPLRIFYESLYNQIPNSEMAQIWMMESGLLAKELAHKIFEKKQKKNPKLSSPSKAVSSSKDAQPTPAKKIATSPVSSAKKKTTDSKPASKQSNKRKVADESSEDSDDDFVVATRIKKKPRAS